MSWFVGGSFFQLSELFCSLIRDESEIHVPPEKPVEKLMTKKLLAIPLVLAIALCVCANSAFAEGTKKSEPGTPVEVKETSTKEITKSNVKLKKDMEKLLADSKAGKVAPRPQQFPRTSRSNLSKTTKIALIAVAAGSAIFLAILFHDLSKD